jgi:dTDP-4-amino-4,6-dideoxygalactose transaminase
MAMLRSCSLGHVVDGPDVQQLEQRLATLLSTPLAVACSSGRAALELALRATNVAAGDEVIVPTFCCASVIPPILAIGAVPVLADVGEGLSLTPNSVEAACSPRTRAVVVAHLFGNPAPIDRIADLCSRRGFTLIDDAAQALGATRDGQPLGTFGDAGIVSFGNGKICSGTGGGAVVSREQAVLERARLMRFPRWQTIPVLKRAAAVTVWRRWRRWSLPLHVVLRRLGRSGGRSASYVGRGMTNLDAAVALSLLETLGANLAARRARLDEYWRLLGNASGLSLVPHWDGSACLTQLVDCHGDEKLSLQIVRTLRRAGYEVDRSYRPLHLQTEYTKFARSALPNAERVWPGLVELPCEPSVAIDDIRRIAALIHATAGV